MSSTVMIPGINAIGKERKQRKKSESMVTH